MPKNEFASRFNSSFILSLIIYLISYLFFLIHNELYHFNTNTNTISAISIAEKYIRGDFSNAVNGAYGPLFSWLLIPFLISGINPMHAISILNLILGVMLIISVRILSYRFEMTEGIRNIVPFVMVPVVLFFSLRDLIPDLLTACIIVYYLSIIFDLNYPRKILNGLLCGIVCAIGYLGKSYILPFFIVHFSLFNIFHYLRSTTGGQKKDVLRNAVMGIIVFLIICGPWIFMLSNKYNKITIGTAGAYNFRVTGPEVKEPPGRTGWGKLQWMGHPVYDQGFFAPPNETALSIWEDFTYLIPYMKPWSPFESWDYFKHQIKLILKNIYYTITIFEGSFSIFSTIIILGYLLFVLPFNKLVLRDDRLYPLVTMVLFTGGYLLLHPSERYLWVDNILILLMGAHLLNVLFHNDFFNNARKKTLIIFFALSFIAVPLRNVVFGFNYDVGRFKVLTEELKKYDDLQGHKIASNDKFSETLKLLFYSNMDVRYYGEAKENISDEELESELMKYDIDYYLVWEEPAAREEPQFLSYYREITGGQLLYKGTAWEISGIKIYSLKERI